MQARSLEQLIAKDVQKGKTPATASLLVPFADFFSVFSTLRGTSRYGIGRRSSSRRSSPLSGSPTRSKRPVVSKFHYFIFLPNFDYHVQFLLFFSLSVTGISSYLHYVKKEHTFLTSLSDRILLSLFIHIDNANKQRHYTTSSRSLSKLGTFAILIHHIYGVRIPPKSK
jgi:hypothetical protein